MSSRPTQVASVRRPWFHRTLVVGVPVLLLALALGVLWLDRARSAPGRWSDGLPVGTQFEAAIEAPVEVLWDSVGVPQIWAADEGDLLFVQGWIHAHHRLWQMEMFRRVARGRLAELFGEATLETDRFLRTLGLHRAAQQTADALDPETRLMVQRYVDGVNRRLETLPRLPLEMRLLGLEPEPWTLADVTAIEKILAWDLSAWDSTIDNAETFAALGPEGWDRLRPRYPTWAPTIEGDEPGPERQAGPERPAGPERQPGLGNVLGPERPIDDASWVRADVSAATGAAAALDPALIASVRMPDDARTWLDGRSLVNASNSWVVGPERSASGAPLLANDPHLALDQPNIWYVMGLHAPGIDVVGTSVAGMPGIVLGHTPGVAWGFTNAYLDDMDLFVERVDPGDSTRYLTPDGSESFTLHHEVIEVRGRSAPDTLIVRETRHGPIMTPLVARLGSDLIALRWVAHDVSHAQRALRGLMRVETAPELLEVLEDLDVAHQNVVFADTAGAWGYWMAGRIPLRPEGSARLLPAVGWTGEADWLGWLPFEQHPHQIAPERGWIATANHRQSWAPVSDAVSDGYWADPFRAVRINELLEGDALLDADDMARIQGDVVSAFALRYRPAAVAAYRSAGLESSATLLERWDGAHGLESRAAPLFHAWFRDLHRRLGRAEWGGEDGWFPRSLAMQRLDEGRVPPDLAHAAAEHAADVVAGRSWGEVHQLTLDHPLAAVGALRVLGGFGRTGIPRRGGPHTVDVAGMAEAGPPWTVRWGASQRHVVDLADPDATGTFVVPGGSSGWPGDPWSMNLLEPWRAGGRVSVPLSRAKVEARTLARLEVHPEAAAR